AKKVSCALPVAMITEVSPRSATERFTISAKLSAAARPRSAFESNTVTRILSNCFVLIIRNLSSMIEPFPADHRSPAGKIILEDGYIGIFSGLQAALLGSKAANAGRGQACHSYRCWKRHADLIYQNWQHFIQKGCTARKGTPIQHHAHAIMNIVS